MFVTCVRCPPKDAARYLENLKPVMMPDNGVIESTCPRGHQQFNVSQQVRFELLSKLAVSAIADGYYREGVASFTASLERLFEFYVDIICRHRGIEPDQFHPTWKRLANQSERQIGAFCLAYLLENGVAPKLLKEDTWVRFRNNVIHKGYFPTAKETIAFGQAVADLVAPLLDLLKSEHYADALTASTGDHLRQRVLALGPNAFHVTNCAVTPFCLATAATGPIDIAGLVDVYAKLPPLWQRRPDPAV